MFAGGKGHAETSRAVALTVSLITFVLSIPLYMWFELGEGGMQFTEQAEWIPAFGISYHLGIDGFAMPLILLTTFTTVLVIIASWEVIKDKVPQSTVKMIFEPLSIRLLKAALFGP